MFKYYKKDGQKINMNYKRVTIISLIVFLALTGIASYSKAAISPSLSFSYYPNSSSEQVTIYADPNAPIQLYYLYQYSNPTFAGTIGYTDYNGYFSSPINNVSYNIPPNSLVYVVVDGVSSQEISWPGNYNYNYNYIPNYNYTYANNYNYNYGSQVSFSQNNISLPVGQSTTVTLYGGYGSYYLSSSSSLVGTGINGNILSIYANSSGSTVLTVCSYNSLCNNLYVNVYYNNVIYYPQPQYQYYPMQYQQYQRYPIRQYPHQYYPHYPQGPIMFPMTRY